MDFLKDILGIGKNAFNTAVNWKSSKKGSKSLKEQFEDRENWDNYNIISQLSKGKVKTGIKPLDIAGQAAGKITDPISDLVLKAGKGVGTAFIQTPILGATQGKVNIPFSTAEDLEETSGDDLLERVVGSGEWAFKNVSEPLANLATIAKKPATAAASATIGAAGQMLSNKAEDKPIFSDLDKGAQQGLNNAYILALSNGVTNSILSKIPGGSTFLEGNLSTGWKAAREGGKLLSKDVAIMAAKQLTRGLIETPAETMGFATWDTIKNDKKFTEALEENFYSALLGNAMFHSGASAAQISPLIGKNIMQVLKKTLADSKFDIPKMEFDTGKNVQSAQNAPIFDTTKGKVPTVDELVGKTKQKYNSPMEALEEPSYRKPKVSTKFYKEDITDFDQARDTLKNKDASPEELIKARDTINVLAENYLSKPEQVKIGGSEQKLLNALAKKFTTAEETQSLLGAGAGFEIDEEGNFGYNPEMGAAGVLAIGGIKSKQGKQLMKTLIDNVKIKDVKNLTVDNFGAKLAAGDETAKQIDDQIRSILKQDTDLQASNKAFEDTVQKGIFGSGDKELLGKHSGDFATKYNEALKKVLGGADAKPAKGFEETIYHHGTPNPEARIKEGFSLDNAGARSGYKGIMGKGVYLDTQGGELASQYGQPIEVQIKKGLKLYEWKGGTEDFYIKETKYGDPEEITKYLQKKGYDGVSGNGQMVIFDPKNVKAVQVASDLKPADDQYRLDKPQQPPVKPADYYEKDGRNLMEWENGDLRSTELRRKIDIAREAGELDIARQASDDLNLRIRQVSNPDAKPRSPKTDDLITKSNKEKRLDILLDPKNRITRGGLSPQAAKEVEALRTDDLITKAKEPTQPTAPPPVPEIKPIKQRGFTETVVRTPGTPKKIVKAVESDPASYYGKVTNEETVRNVQENILPKGEEYALKIAKTEDDPNANATAMLMLDKYLKAGEFEKFTSLMNEVNPRFTKQGQQIQILSLYGRLTPTGAVKYTQKILDEANKVLPPKRQLKLEELTIKEVKQLAENIAKTENGTREHQIAVAKLLDRIASEVPPSLGQKVATIQTMAQLLNPKTLIRNTAGNTGFAAVENVKDVLATGIDKLVSNVTGVRTKSLPSLTGQVKSAQKGFKLGLEDAILGVDTSKGLTTQFDLPTRTFREGFLGQAEKVLNISLRATDRAAYTAAFDESLRQQMKAANVAEPTEKMLASAHADGLYRTFQDDSRLSQVFRGIKKILNKVGTRDGKFGLGDLILKYPKTPANLLARGLDYSPAGFVKSAFEVYKPLVEGTEFEQKQFVEHLSRALTGSSIMALGFVLSDVGIVTGKPEKDADIRATQRLSGEGGFKFNIDAFKRFVASGFDEEAAKGQEGDTLVSYDWFQPQSFTFSMGVNAAKGSKDAKDYMASIADGLNSGVSTLTEQPLVTGVTRFAQTTNLQGAASAFMESFLQAPASFTPSLLNQVGQATDNTARETYSNNPLVENLINRVKARVPGARNTLPARKDVFGQDLEQYQDGSNNIFNVFFNPAFVTKLKRNPEAKEVLDIFESSGETQQAPRLVDKKVKINGEEKVLTSDELSQYQTYVGQKTQTAFAQLMSQPKWNTMSDEDKAKAMSNAITDINSAAKIELFGNQMKSVPKDVKQILAGTKYAGTLDTTTRNVENMGITGNTQELIDTFELNKYVNSKETGVAKLKLDKEKVGVAVDILNGTEAYEGLTDDQKVSLIESMGVAVDDVQYASIAGEDTDIKVAMIQEQNLDHDQLIKTLTMGRQKSIKGELFASDSMLDQLYYEGMITSAERTALKKLDYNSSGELRAGATGGGTGKSKTDKELSKVSKEITQGAPNQKSVDQLIAELKKEQPTYKVPKGTSDVNLTTSVQTAKRLAAQVPTPDQLIKRARAVASANTTEARKVNDKLRGGGSPGRTILAIRTGGRRA